MSDSSPETKPTIQANDTSEPESKPVEAAQGTQASAESLGNSSPKKSRANVVGKHMRPSRNGSSRIFKKLKSESINTSIVVISLMIIAATCVVVTAVVLRFVSPKSRITVSAFQIFEADSKSSNLNGKAVADLLVDDLHQILETADQFSGTAYSSPKSFRHLPDLPQIPVDTSYGLEIKGISVDQIISSWNHLRYREFAIGGDLLPGTKTGSIMKVRYETSGEANSYEQLLPRIDPASLKSAVQEMSLDLVKDISPQAAARYLNSKASDCESGCETLWNDEVSFGWTWVKKNPQDPLALFYFGRALIDAERSEESIIYLERAYKIDKKLDLALTAKGTALIYLGRFSDAEAELKSAIAIRKTPNSLVDLGLNAYLQGDFAKAENFYNEALTLDPFDVGAALSLGHASLNSGRYPAAVNAYSRALELQPGNLIALEGLARSLPKIGRARDALRMCEAAARLDPTSPEPVIAEGISYLKNNEVKKAIEKFNASLKIEDKPAANLQLGIAYVYQGRLDAAERKVKHILEAIPNYPQALLVRGEILGRQGRNREGRSEKEKAEELYPGAKNDFVDDVRDWPQMKSQHPLLLGK